MVWSQEAFCHAMDHSALMAEVQRVLKPGGTAVFSDIMQSDNGGDCTSFTGQNVTTKLASPNTYKVLSLMLPHHPGRSVLQHLPLAYMHPGSRCVLAVSPREFDRAGRRVQEAIKTTGMKLCEYKDLTHHLTKYFQCMLDAVKESKLPLQMRGVSLARLEAYEEDLVIRFDAVKQRSFAWGMFSCQNMFSSDALLNGATYGTDQCPDQMEEVCTHPRHLLPLPSACPPPPCIPPPYPTPVFNTPVSLRLLCSIGMHETTGPSRLLCRSAAPDQSGCFVSVMLCSVLCAVTASQALVCRRRGVLCWCRPPRPPRHVRRRRRPRATAARRRPAALPRGPARSPHLC